jgi:hypothetical protein
MMTNTVFGLILAPVLLSAGASAQTAKPATVPAKRAATAARGRTTTSPAIKSDCSPSAAELRALASELYAKNPDTTEFLRALDNAVGVAPSATAFDRSLMVSSNDELTVLVLFPYYMFRTNLTEAIRKKESVGSAEVPPGVNVVVSPSQIDAPDIIKIVVERDGKTITPLATSLAPHELVTRMGAKRLIHAGEVLYQCSAFAPGANVTVTAIPDTGANLVKVFSSNTLNKKR